MVYVLHFTDDVVICGSREEAAAIVLVSRVVRRALVRMHLRLDSAKLTLPAPCCPVTFLGHRFVVDYRNLD